MGCPDANLLAAFVDARLGAEESEAVEQHVDSCRECGELIAELARAGGTDPRRAETPAELVTPAPLRGRALGEFVVRAPLGEGGFGAVYLAEQKGLGREAVVKVPHLRHRASPAMVERFMREARLASRLDHPYAAHVYAFGAEPDGLLWIAMERVRGTTLSELLERQTRIPLERLVPLLDRLCEVVQSAHEMGIVHRDIKPANVMVLSRAGRLLPKLLDFGVAKLVDEPELAGGGGAPGLTLAGALVGTPPYMAPELWGPRPMVDGRVDVYALGVLIHEALTGKRPFAMTSMRELAQAHAAAAVPPLGDGFPAALDAVVARAMAKRPEDRFAQPVELAAALRQAAGLGDEAEGLPRLDERVRARALELLPQPLAESVALLDAARNAHQARDAAWHLLRAAGRFVGVVALACRAHVGGRPPSPALVDHLRALGRPGEGLGDTEWLQLAVELTRPFVDAPGTHPLPDLVRALHGRLGAIFDELHALHRGGPASSDASPGSVRELYATALTGLARLLDELALFERTPLVVPRAGWAESWSGLRRTPRASAVFEASARPGEPLLVDVAGRPVVVLAPLARVAPPSPGAADELFLFAGRGRLVSFPQGFELVDEGLHDWFRAHLLDVDEARGGTSAGRPPYRGLEAFAPADADRFVGREREVAWVKNRLRTTPLVAVVGPSGAGKSSFVQAGLVPSLPEGWSAITVRPGPRPLAALAARAGDDLLQRARGSGGTLVLVVDQLEELFTSCGSEAEQLRFAQLLASATVDDPLRVVVTLRDDYLVRAESLPPLRGLLARGLELLTVPSPADLERILVEPARRAGYVFDDATLPGEMVRAVAGEPGALALLSFTALRLWELRDRQFKQLRRRSYEAMGSVGGALAAHAEGLLARMTVEEQRLAREAFRHLGTADGLRTVLGTAELAATLGGERGGAVIQALVDGRLLVASEDERGEPTVEVAHEALFTAWPRLAAWRREEAEGARLRDQLRSAARQWQDRGRPRGLLWRDDALAEYRQWRARHPGAVTPLEAQFAGASLAAAARGGRLRMTLIAAAFAVLSVGLLALWRLYGEAERRTAELSAEQGRQALLAGDPVRALEHLDEALRRGLDTPALRYLVARGAKLVAKRRLALLGHGDQLTSGDWAPDGAHLATASRDGGVAVWDARGGERLHTASFGDRAVRVAFDAGGARLVSCGQQAARLSDVATGAVLLAIDPGAAIADCELAVDGRSLLIDLGDAGFGVWDARTGVVRFTVAMPGLHGAMPSLSPDATRVASGGADGVLRIWSIDDGRLTAEQHGHSDRIRRPAWRPDGALIATPSLDGTARVWTAAGEPRAVLRGHAGWIYSAMFSPDGKIVATGSYDQTARLWDAATGELRATLLGHRGPINGLAFSPDGERLATASSDGTARTWDVATGKVLGLCAGHTGALFRIDFSPDGRELLTVSWDATAGVWDAARDDAVAVLRGAAGLYHMGLLRSREVLTATADGTVTLWSPAGKRVSSHRPPLARPEPDVFATDGGRRLVAAEGATAVVWDLVTGAPLARLEGHGHRVSSAAFDARGERLAVGGDDGAIAIYATDGWSRLATLEGHEGSVEALAFDGAGTRLASAGQDRAAVIWRLPEGTVERRLLGHALALTSVSFGPAGLVTTSHDNTARLWRRDGTPVATLAHSAAVLHAAFSPDGELVATGGTDNVVSLWEARSGHLLAALEGHSATVMRVEFAAGGSRLLSASLDGSVIAWEVMPLGAGAGEIHRFVACATHGGCNRGLQSLFHELRKTHP